MSKESAQAALGKFAEAVNTGNFDAWSLGTTAFVRDGSLRNKM